MHQIPTPLEGVSQLRFEPHRDERGTFSRFWSTDIARSLGLDQDLEWSFSTNHREGTLRGMHWQDHPHTETKVVRCVKGAVFDVAVDVRADSTTYGNWFGVELQSDELNALLIGPGLAHGFLTMEDDCIVQYGIAGSYAPDSARGVRWDDPFFDIKWPAEPIVISARDASYPYVEELNSPR